MELISYAMDFASFFMQNSKHSKSIKSILIFGSAARGEATKDSDVDIFIDITDKEVDIEKETKKAVNDFYNSVKYRDYWRLLGVQNEISVVSGFLDKWKLKDSMAGSSIVLYGPFSQQTQDGKNKIILTWGNIKNNSKRVMLNKKLFGHKHYKHTYQGIMQTHEGVKLGTNVLLIPTEHLNLFLKELRKFKAKTRIIRVLEYTS